jgi:Cd2+/Zn2+-exporting ATPase
LTGQGVEGDLVLNNQPTSARMGRRSMFPPAWTRAMAEPEIGVTETLIEAGTLRGRVLLRDSVRESSQPLLRNLAARGIKTTMLTGDRPEAAQQVATHLGLAEVRAGLKPEQKVEAIQGWVRDGERVAMIGDGVNDAPSLAAAQVAVGMGLRGSDAVLEQADVVLMQDKLENFIFALDLSCSARTIIRQNLAISLGTVAILVLSAMGSAIPLPLGVVGHEGSTVIVVLNSLRLLFRRPATAAA